MLTLPEMTAEGDYPHRYLNHENFNFHNDECKKQKNRYGFPVAQSSYYNGGNDPPYNFRGIYVYKGEEDVQTHPMATYCGTIYHLKGGLSRLRCHEIDYKAVIRCLALSLLTLET